MLTLNSVQCLVRCRRVVCQGPDLYYYEVLECGRRILLTGVLLFIEPNGSAQAAIACIFAFASLLGFELLRPHLDPADAWLYRMVRYRSCKAVHAKDYIVLDFFSAEEYEGQLLLKNKKMSSLRGKLVCAGRLVASKPK